MKISDPAEHANGRCWRSWVLGGRENFGSGGWCSVVLEFFFPFFGGVLRVVLLNL